MKNAIKQILSLETIDESIDVNGVMTGVLSEVDAGTEQRGDATAYEMDNVGDDIEAAQGYVDLLEQSPPEGAAPATLAVAQVGLESIFSKYGIVMKVVSQESADYSDKLATFQTIQMANEGIGEMVKSFGESIKNVIDRIRVNMKDTFRRRAAWTSEAIKLRAKLHTATGAPMAGATYTNRVRVAHMTKGDQSVITDPKAMLKAVESVEVSLNGLSELIKGVASMYTIFNSNKGSVDFNKIANAFDTSEFSKDQLSLTGAAALFGEEITTPKFEGTSTDVKSMLAIAAGIKFNHTNIWKVGDLEQPALEPLDIQSMKSGVDDMVRVGQVICDMYNRRDREFEPYLAAMYDKANSGFDIDMVISPINYIRFNRLYKRLMYGILKTVESSFDLNFKAATCLLEYWKWSIANNK